MSHQHSPGIIDILCYLRVRVACFLIPQATYGLPNADLSCQKSGGCHAGLPWHLIPTEFKSQTSPVSEDLVQAWKSFVRILVLVNCRGGGGGGGR